MIYDISDNKLANNDLLLLNTNKYKARNILILQKGEDPYKENMGLDLLYYIKTQALTNGLENMISEKLQNYNVYPQQINLKIRDKGYCMISIQIDGENLDLYEG